MHNTNRQPTIYSKIIQSVGVVVYTLVISLVLFGVIGYSCSQVIENLPIGIWVSIFIGALLIALVLVIYFRTNDYGIYTFSLKNMFLGLIPYLVLLPGTIALLYSVRVQLSNHGAFHLGYIFQILHGFAPPENVALPGYPGNIYWLYHALIAVLADIFNTAPPLIAALLNLTALAASIYWIRKSIRLIGLGERNSFLTSCYSLLILFSTNLFGSLNSLLNYLLYRGDSLKGFTESLSYKYMILGDDLRLVSLSSKFFNFNGTPLGIMYFTFALYISIRILNGKLSTKKILLLAVALSGTLLFHTPTGIYALLVIPLSVLISLILSCRERISDYFKSTNPYELTLELFVLLVIFIPTFHYVYEGASALPAKTLIGTAMSYNFIKIISTAYPLIPLSLLGAYIFYRKKRSTVVLLSVLSALGYLVSIVFELPNHNQYKFIFLATMSFSILGVMALDYINFELKGVWKRAGKTVFTAFLIISGFSILMPGLSYLTSKRFSEDTYYYENSQILMIEGSKYKDAFEWIRDHTSEDTIVILPFPSKNTGTKENQKGSIFIVTERLPYVAYGQFFTTGIKEYQIRKRNVKLFYSETTPVDKKIEILSEFEKFSKEMPAVLLIPKDQLKPYSSYLENMVLLYSGKDANIYSFKGQ